MTSLPSRINRFVSLSVYAWDSLFTQPGRQRSLFHFPSSISSPSNSSVQTNSHSEIEVSCYSIVNVLLSPVHPETKIGIINSESFERRSIILGKQFFGFLNFFRFVPVRSSCRTKQENQMKMFHSIEFYFLQQQKIDRILSQ